MLISFNKTNLNAMKIITDKHNISKQQPILNQVEKFFSNRTQKTILPIIIKIKTKWIQTIRETTMLQTKVKHFVPKYWLSDSTKTYAEITSQSNQQKYMGQTNTQRISEEKPRAKQSNNHYCTWYSRTRSWYQWESTFFILRPK